MNQEDQEDLDYTEVRLRQKSCIVPKLNKEDLEGIDIQMPLNRRATISKIMKMDNEDESLKKYKQAILGDINNLDLKDGMKPEVEFVCMELVCNNRPQGNIMVSLIGDQAKEFILKEDEIYNFRIHFRVRNDCVIGLKFYNSIKRHHIPIDKYEEPMGSYAPKKMIQIWNMQETKSPSGFLARGSYKGKAMFIDKDGICHMQYEYSFKISKQWD